MLISIFTGLAAGALHVVGGADHLIAMAPSGIRSPKQALRDGLAWGVGHSTGVLFLSSLAILIKDFADIQRFSTFAELCVGFVLLFIGLLAIKTAFGLNIHSHRHNHNNGHIHDHIHIHFGRKRKHFVHQHAATSLGVLHGLAGASHLLAVIPALALPPFAAVCYMFFYLLGSIIAMGLFLSVISLAYLRVGAQTLPFLIGITGVLSVMIGLVWIQKSSPQIIY